MSSTNRISQWGIVEPCTLPKIISETGVELSTIFDENGTQSKIIEGGRRPVIALYLETKITDPKHLQMAVRLAEYAAASQILRSERMAQEEIEAWFSNQTQIAPTIVTKTEPLK